MFFCDLTGEIGNHVRTNENYEPKFFHLGGKKTQGNFPGQ